MTIVGYPNLAARAWRCQALIHMVHTTDRQYVITAHPQIETRFGVRVQMLLAMRTDRKGRFGFSSDWE